MTPAARLPFQASRASCVFALSLVFLTGALAGAVVMNLSGVHRHRTTPFYTDAGKAFSLQKLKKDLNLNPEQVKDLENILDDFGIYYRNVLSDGKNRVLKILDDEQKKKFEKMLGEAMGPSR
jgi:hypothetical protein